MKQIFFMFGIFPLNNGDVDEDAILTENLRPTTSSNNSEVRNKIVTDYIYMYFNVVYTSFITQQ